MLTQRPTEDAVLSLDDDELMEVVYECVALVADHTVADALHWLLREAFERFAPESEWRALERLLGEEDGCELEAARRAVRRRQGARMLRDLLEGDDHAS